MADLLKTILVPEEFCILKTDSQRKMTLIINNEVGERLVTQEESSS